MDENLNAGRQAASKLTAVVAGGGDVVEQLEHRTDQGGDVGEGGGIKNLAHPFAFGFTDEAQAKELFLGPGTGVIFHRQRDELEQCQHRKNGHCNQEKMMDYM